MPYNNSGAELVLNKCLLSIWINKLVVRIYNVVDVRQWCWNTQSDCGQEHSQGGPSLLPKDRPKNNSLNHHREPVTREQGTGEIAQWQRALTALVEDQCLVLRTHIRQHTIPVTLAPGNLTQSPGVCRHQWWYIVYAITSKACLKIRIQS